MYTVVHCIIIRWILKYSLLHLKTKQKNKQTSNLIAEAGLETVIQDNLRRAQPYWRTGKTTLHLDSPPPIQRKRHGSKVILRLLYH